MARYARSIAPLAARPPRTPNARVAPTLDFATSPPSIVTPFVWLQGIARLFETKPSSLTEQFAFHRLGSSGNPPRYWRSGRKRLRCPGAGKRSCLSFLLLSLPLRLGGGASGCCSGGYHFSSDACHHPCPCEVSLTCAPNAPSAGCYRWIG